MDIDQILDQIYVLPTASKGRLIKHIDEVRFQKNYRLFHADKIENKIYFIKKGIVRAFVIQNDGETTFWFGQEGGAVLSMRSYVEGKPGYETIELLEDCELYELKMEALQKLYAEDVHIANWGRKLAEQELIKTEERFISRQFRTATERYDDLLKNEAALIKRVQLGYIASYLGITQVSLSRIRAEIK